MVQLFCKKFGMKVPQQRIEAYLDRLYGYAYNLTNDREYARDLVQTCAVKVLTAKKIPVDEPAYRAWLFKICRNAYHDEIRKNAGNIISLDQVDDCGESLGNKIADTHVSINEQTLINQLTVRSALKRLCHDHREILVLVDIAGFSYREAADLLNVPIGTIMSRVSRARRVLLKVLIRDQSQPAALKVVRLKQSESRLHGMRSTHM